MDARLIAGTIISYAYNDWVGRIPSRTIRSAFLRAWLGALGRGTGVQMGCRIYNGRKVFLGDHTVVNHGCLLDGRRYTVRIGDNASIGPEAVLLTLGHDPQSSEFALKGGDVFVGDRVFIGYRAIVMPGVSIGEGAVVGAGSVVTKNIEPYTIVAGNPARVIGQRTRELIYTLDFQPLLQ
jgi:acetyltransferase-like isoleucine patch superfamily enzyme